mgnify:CR=1 FL=1
MNDRYYNSLPNHINIYLYFIDSSKNVINIQNFTHELVNSMIEKNKIYSIIDENKIYNNMNFNLYKILKFNIDVDFIKFITSDFTPYDFLDKKNISNIYFSNTIRFLHKYNSLFFLFKST